jgi:hypothetical protein
VSKVTRVSRLFIPGISYNVENFFFLKCMTTMPGWIYIYSFLFSVHLIKCKAKKKKHHAVETFQKSNILNDIEQLFEHTISTLLLARKQK